MLQSCKRKGLSVDSRFESELSESLQSFRYISWYVERLLSAKENYVDRAFGGNEQGKRIFTEKLNIALDSGQLRESVELTARAIRQGISAQFAYEREFIEGSRGFTKPSCKPSPLVGDLIERYPERIKGANVLELGVGASVGSLIALLNAGANHVIGVDSSYTATQRALEYIRENHANYYNKGKIEIRHENYLSTLLEIAHGLFSVIDRGSITEDPMPRTDFKTRYANENEINDDFYKIATIPNDPMFQLDIVLSSSSIHYFTPGILSRIMLPLIQLALLRRNGIFALMIKTIDTPSASYHETLVERDDFKITLGKDKIMRLLLAAERTRRSLEECFGVVEDYFTIRELGGYGAKGTQIKKGKRKERFACFTGQSKQTLSM